MGRSPCCDKSKVKKGPWSPEEDEILRNYIQNVGTGGNWIALPTKAGLKRCGKSCRLRWLNYLRPDIKHGAFTDEEDNAIFALFSKLGSRWSVIASHLPGRTDNDVKNHWNTKLKKKLIPHDNFKTSFYETNFRNANNDLLSFQNPSFFGLLVHETDSDFSPNSNISTLIDQSSPSMSSTNHTLNYNYNYNYNLTYATSPIGDNVSSFGAFPMESMTSMLHYGHPDVPGFGISKNLEMEGAWAQEIMSEFGSFNYPNLGYDDVYQSVTKAEF